MMTAEDFAEEIANYNINPWGDEWGRTSLLASQFYNANKPKSAKAVEADHFIPKSRQGKAEDVAAKLNAFFSQHERRNGT